MNIVIFDLQHYEMINVIIKVFNESSNTITLFTNNNILNKVKKSESDLIINAVCIDDFKSEKEFLIKCYEVILNKKANFIILNTIDRNYKGIWSFLKKVDIPIIVTIHNVNTWLRPPFTLNKLALSYYYYRKKITNKTKAIIVQEELFINYIKQNNLYKKAIFTLPHTLKEKDVSLNTNEKLVIAIPGAIDGHRRDYDFCLSAIEKIYNKNTKVQFKFVGEVVGFLGEKIFERIKLLQAKGIDIVHVFDPNSNELFDTEMSKCDIVFLPINVYTKYEGITEIYGQTKVTGVLYDMMRFQKPGIVPSALIVPSTIESSIIHYNNEEDLIVKTVKVINDASILKSLQNNAKINSQYYTKEAIKKRFYKDFTEYIL